MRGHKSYCWRSISLYISAFAGETFGDIPPVGVIATSSIPLHGISSWIAEMACGAGPVCLLILAGVVREPFLLLSCNSGSSTPFNISYANPKTQGGLLNLCWKGLIASFVINRSWQLVKSIFEKNRCVFETRKFNEKLIINVA